jgi:hypothetical protein
MRICDKCDNLHINESQTYEHCAAKFYQLYSLPAIPKEYFESRLNGDKQDCKHFEKLRTLTIK